MSRIFQHYFSEKKAALFVLEFSGAVVSAGVSAWVVWSLSGLAEYGSSFRGFFLVVLLALLFQYSAYLNDLYDLNIARSDYSDWTRHFRASALFVFVMAGIVLVLSWGQLLQNGVVLTGSLSIVASSYLIRRKLSHVFLKKSGLLIVGDSDSSDKMLQALESENEGTVEVLGVLNAQTVCAAQDFKGNTHSDQGQVSLVQLVRQIGATSVVVCQTNDVGMTSFSSQFDSALLECRIQGVNVVSASQFCERILRKFPVELLNTTWLALNDEFRTSWFQPAVKRGADFVLASILFVFSLPIGVLTALAIKVDSRGPIFYRQERVGYRGKVFALWKFRSMRVDAESQGAVWAQKNDSRITRVGKFIRRTRIDEIPQVLNVLAGDMSFVGPRPERPVFVEEIKRVVPFYSLREHAKPGLTGWAQIRYPYGASIEDARKKLEYDLYYIKNHSLGFDLSIVFHTVRHVLQGRGAR